MPNSPNISEMFYFRREEHVRSLLREMLLAHCLTEFQVDSAASNYQQEALKQDKDFLKIQIKESDA